MRLSASLRVALILSAITVLAQVAEAQEKKVGLLIGVPLDVGVFWQTSERVALRADVGFSFNTFESSNSAGLSLGSGARSTITTTSSSNFTTIGLSALFTIRNENNLRLYLAPRAAIEFTHSSVETEIDPPTSTITVGGEASGSTRGHEYGVAFGGQQAARPAGLVWRDRPGVPAIGVPGAHDVAVIWRCQHERLRA